MKISPPRTATACARTKPVQPPPPSPADGPRPATVTFAPFLESSYAAAPGGAPASAPTPAGGPPPALQSALDGFLGREDELNAMLDRVAAGESLSPQELIRLQMLVCACAFQVELATRVVDRGLGSFRQLTNMQL